MIILNADAAQHCAMAINAFNYIPPPLNGKTVVSPVLSMNWRCTICAMHFAYGHPIAAPEKMRAVWR